MKNPARTTKEHLEWIGIRGSRWAWATSVGAIALWASLAYAPGHSAIPPTIRPTLQEYTADATTPLIIGTFLRAKLPAPDPRQRRPPCVVRVGEEAINGFCWLRLRIDPPCPVEDQAYEHNGGCYVAVLRAAGPPTSRDGEIPVGVASPTTP